MNPACITCKLMRDRPSQFTMHCEVHDYERSAARPITDKHGMCLYFVPLTDNTQQDETVVALLHACKVALSLLPADVEHIHLLGYAHRTANLLLSTAIAKAETEILP